MEKSKVTTEKLSFEDIDHLAKLSRLNLSVGEKEKFAHNLSSIVDYVEQLGDIDVSKSGLDAKVLSSGVTGMKNVLAEDVVRSMIDPRTVDTMKIVGGAPMKEHRYFAVRAVMNGEES